MSQMSAYNRLHRGGYGCLAEKLGTRSRRPLCGYQELPDKNHPNLAGRPALPPSPWNSPCRPMETGDLDQRLWRRTSSVGLGTKKQWAVVRALASLLFMFGCRPQGSAAIDESGSLVKGYPFGKYLKGLYSESAMLDEVGTALHKNLVKSVQQNRGLLTRQLTPRQLLGAEVIKLLSENHFLLNREQLGKVLKSLTDSNGDKGVACAGVPCARVFGFRSNEVENVIDDILERLVANPDTLKNLGMVKRNALLYGLSAKFKAREFQVGFLKTLREDQQYYQYFFNRDLVNARSLRLDVFFMNSDANQGLGFRELSRLPNLKILHIEGIWSQPDVLDKLLEEKTYVRQAKSVRLNIENDGTIMFNRHPDIISRLLTLPHLNHLTINLKSLNVLREFQIKSIPANIKSVAFEVRSPRPKDGPNTEWSLAPFFDGPSDERRDVRFEFDVPADRIRERHHLTFER